MKKIAIFGAGGCGREVKWLIDDINKAEPSWEFIGFFDDHFPATGKVDPSLHLGGMDALNSWGEELAIIFGIGNPITKRKIIASATNPKLYFPTLIHPNVVCSHHHVNIGEGTVICAGNMVMMDIEIGKHVYLSLGCTVGHDAMIGDFSSVMPSVNISGEVKLGACVYIGTGAKIINQLEIGEETIVGAGAVVVSNLPPRCTAVGLPAKPIKFHS